MGTDRFVHFEPGKVPGRDDIGTLIEDYLGDVMRSIEWGAGRWTVLLKGECSYPFRRLEPEWTPTKAWAEEQWLIRPLFAWYDLWVGAYWDRARRLLYILPLPTLGVVVNLNRPRRWIEVCIGDDNIDVITRHQDELTMVIADGLAAIIARYWKGRLEEPD